MSKILVNVIRLSNQEAHSAGRRFGEALRPRLLDVAHTALADGRDPIGTVAVEVERLLADALAALRAAAASDG
jgi:hypothetical protein